MNILNKIVQSYRIKEIYGTEENYYMSMRNKDNTIRYEDLQKKFGDKWFEKGSFITAIQYSSTMTHEGNSINFWIDFSEEEFREVMLYNRDTDKKIKELSVYKLTNDFFPKFLETTLLLDSITEYYPNTSQRKFYVETFVEREDFKNYRKAIENKEIELTTKAEKKISKELKRYTDYLNREYVYSNYWYPGIYEKKGFPENKYACLEFTDKQLKPEQEKQVKQISTKSP